MTWKQKRALERASRRRWICPVALERKIDGVKEGSRKKGKLLDENSSETSDEDEGDQQNSDSSNGNGNLLTPPSQHGLSSSGTEGLDSDM